MRNKITVPVLSAVAGLVLAAVPTLAQPEPGWLLRETAKDYRAQAAYPENCHVLFPGDADPVRAKRTPSPIVARGENGSGPTLAVWAAEVSFEHPRPVELYARLADTFDKVLRRAVVTGEVVRENGEVVATLDFRDDGLEADAVAGDGVHAVRFELPQELLPELAESFAVRVRATLPGGTQRLATGGFLYSRPWARLTGRYRDRVVDGNLVIAAEVEVSRAGRFHLAATLYGADGEPVGTAQSAARLEPGKHWLEVPFYGLMFHQRGLAGPYRVGSLALATAGAMPNALSELQVDVHQTRAYRLKRFTARPFANPELLDAARRLEREAARISTDR
ncbi:MAG: hypothetical protein D6696_04515 [Acidobacteria bacterium]|nr:MAG: hypothetical protein D6696_04515 [Acidobacteriota bacterium]